MEFRILGPLELWSGGQHHHPGWAKERIVLAVLLMTPRRPVTAEALIDRVWDTHAPAKARDLLYPHIARLRAILRALDGDVRLEHRSGAYVLNVDPEQIDYHRFRSLRDQARAIADSGHHDDAVNLYGEALKLWRGEPLDGVTGAWAAQRRHGIREELLDAALRWARLELDRGRHAEIIGRLHELADGFPDDEKPVELLMLALHRGGRSAEALRVYERARQRLADELGATPHAHLRDLHRRILADDPALLRSAHPPRDVPRPNDLPRDLSTFTGRSDELERLTAMAERDGDTMTVVAIDGMPGVGKTVLAVRLAHRLAPRYPDGQIYLELYAHDPDHEPLSPASALDRLLRALGIPADRIPPDLDGRTSLWRTEIARRRVLLVLDNALGHEQIRRLLPGSPGCLVLVTSRRRLSGLDAARTLSLDVLAPDDAALLLARAAELDPDADPAAVAKVVRLCGHLPLALQLVGNRLRHRTTWTVADLAARLSAGNRRLAEIRAENRTLVAVFGLSYEGLDAVTRRAFRLLALHPGTDLTAADAAALLATDPAEAESLLDTLHDHHLIIDLKGGRYRFHDLVHEYARQLADQDPAPTRDAALDRLLDHYLTATEQADRALFPRHAAPSAQDESQARTWLSTELDNLLRAARHAFEHNRHRHAALLARALRQYVEQQGPWSEAAALHERAVHAWRTLGDDRQAARALADLSRILLRAGHHESSLRRATQGLELARGTGDPGTVATLLDQLGLIHWQRSELDVALGYCEQALHIWRSLGDRAGEAEALHHRGMFLWHMGRYAEAAEATRAALALYEQIGDRRGRQMTLNNLGDLEMRLGRYSSALQHYEDAAATVMEMSLHHRAMWLNNVAMARLKNGHTSGVVEKCREALTIFRELGDRRNEVACLNSIGLWYAHLDRHGGALIHFQKALNLARESSERYEATRALRNMADTYHRTGRHGLALRHYEDAAALARSINEVYEEACALDGMAQVVAQTRGPAHAAPHRRQALHLFEQLGTPEAETVRARLLQSDDASNL